VTTTSSSAAISTARGTETCLTLWLRGALGTGDFNVKVILT